MMTKCIDYHDIINRFNQSNILHPKFADGYKRLESFYAESKMFDEGRGICVLGDPGVGKTSLVKHFANNHRDEILADKTLKEIAFTRLERGTTSKSIMRALFRAINIPMQSTKPAGELLNDFAKLIKRIGVKAVIIDEAQHIKSNSDDTNKSNADFIKLLIDSCEVGWIFCGLPIFNEVSISNGQLIRRLDNPITLTRFDWYNELDRISFISVLSAYRAILEPLELPDFSKDDWQFRWYVATGGFIAYVAEIFRKVLFNASQNNLVKIEINHFAKAHLDAIYSSINTSNLHNNLVNVSIERFSRLRPFTDNYLPQEQAEVIGIVKNFSFPEDIV